jgi:hypothetical protein
MYVVVQPNFIIIVRYQCRHIHFPFEIRLKRQVGLLGFQLRHLRNLVVVTEELHFGRAASRLSLSQPPFSGSIQQLEKAVGAPMFDRDGKSVD